MASTFIILLYRWSVFSPHFIFYTVVFHPMITVIVFHLFSHSLLSQARRAVRLNILIVCQRAVCYALKVLKVFILALIILVNLKCFSESNFFAVLCNFSCCVSCYSKYSRCISLPFFLQVIGSWAVFYISLTALFMSRFTGLLAIFIIFCNAVIFIYKFSGNIAASLLKATIDNLLYFL